MIKSNRARLLCIFLDKSTLSRTSVSNIICLACFFPETFLITLSLIHEYFTSKFAKFSPPHINSSFRGRRGNPSSARLKFQGKVRIMGSRPAQWSIIYECVHRFFPPLILTLHLPFIPIQKHLLIFPIRAKVISN